MKKTLIQDKKILLEHRLDEFRSYIVNSEKSTNITVLDEENLLKAYVYNKIDKIIVSRSGEIEITEKY